MENENILMDEVKVKKKYTVPLIIIAVIVTVLVGVGISFYLKNNDSRGVYFKLIDAFTENVVDGLNEADDIIGKITQSNYNISFNLNSNEEDIKNLSSILNKMKLDIDVETDIHSKKIGMNLGTIYNNQNLVNAKMYINNDKLYVTLGDLYDKAINVPADGLEQIWELYKFDSYQLIIKEITEILKNNLKEEYFEQEKESIELNGKKVNATKNIFTLTGKDLYDLENKVLADIESNDELLSELETVSGLTKEELKSSLTKSKDELVLDESIKITFELYLKGKDCLRFVIKDNDEEIVVMNNVNNNKYEISINEEGELIVIGNVELNDESGKLEFNYDGVEMTADISDKNIIIKAKSMDDVIELKSNINGNQNDGYVRILSSEDDIDLKVNFTSKLKEIDKVMEIDIQNYIELEQMTEDDYNAIMQAIYNNGAFVSLVQDITVLSQS